MSARSTILAKKSDNNFVGVVETLHGRGYDLLKERLMEEKQKKRLEQAAQSGSTKTIVDPPSPIRRQVK